jgi:hypothetical protein
VGAETTLAAFIAHDLLITGGRMPAGYAGSTQIQTVAIESNVR